MARAFVTGGAGFIGRRLVSRLLARGDAVTVLARKPDSLVAQSLKAAGAKVVQGDVTKKESVRFGMEGAEVVYHVAGWYKVGVRDRSPAYPVNVDGTRNTLGLAHEMGVWRILYVSTTNIFGSTHGRVVEPALPERDRWFSEYDRSKYLGYKLVEEFVARGAPIVTCCPSLVYGPDGHSPTDNFIRLLLRRKVPMLPGKASGGMWAHVDDVADGLIAAADKGQVGTIYVLGGDRLTHEEMVRFIGEVSGVPMPMLLGAAPVPLMKGLMSIVAAVVPVPEQYHPETFANLNNVTYWVSQEPSVRDLGFKYRPYQEGLREVILYEMDKLGIRRKG